MNKSYFDVFGQITFLIPHINSDDKRGYWTKYMSEIMEPQGTKCLVYLRRCKWEEISF